MVAFRPIFQPGNDMRSRTIGTTAAVIGAIGFSSAAHAGFVYTTLDAPGINTETLAFGINNAGEVTGYYNDGIGHTHGYIYAAGVFTTIDPPGALTTDARGINNSGQVAGSSNVPGQQLGFVYAAGVFTAIDVPGAPLGINDVGQIVGQYDDGHGHTHGFIYFVGVSTTLDAPGASATSAFAINNAGEIVGAFDNHGFVYTAGVFTTLDVPGASDTWAQGINDSGQIAGDYLVGAQYGGFVYDAGVFETFAVPGAIATIGYGINNVGQISGYYDNASGRHGFIATPCTTGPSCSPPAGVPEPSTLTLFVAGLLSLAGIQAMSRRRVEA